MESDITQVLPTSLIAADSTHTLHEDVNSSVSAGAGHEKTDIAFAWPWTNWKWNRNKSFDANLARNYDQYIGTSIITWFIWMVLGILIWCCCCGGEPKLLPFTADPVDTFQYHHFACFRSPRICCFSLCCPGVQWADTMNLAGLTNFWLAVLAFFSCALVNSLIFGGLACYGIFTTCLILLYRQRLREQLGLKAWGCPGCCFDFLYVSCCPCCAISQEAQVVRLLYEARGATPTIPVSAPSYYQRPVRPPTSGVPAVQSLDARETPSFAPGETPTFARPMRPQSGN